MSIDGQCDPMEEDFEELLVGNEAKPNANTSDMHMVNVFKYCTESEELSFPIEDFCIFLFPRLRYILYVL